MNQYYILNDQKYISNKEYSENFLNEFEALKTQILCLEIDWSKNIILKKIEQEKNILWDKQKFNINIKLHKEQILQKKYNVAVLKNFSIEKEKIDLQTFNAADRITEIISDSLHCIDGLFQTHWLSLYSTLEQEYQNNDYILFTISPDNYKENISSFFNYLIEEISPNYLASKNIIEEKEKLKANMRTDKQKQRKPL